MPLAAFDLRQPELIAQEAGEANRRLASEEAVPDSIHGFVHELGQQIADTEADDLESIDPYMWIELQRVALKLLGTIQEGDPRNERREVRIGLERLRFLMARLAERQPTAEDRPAKEVARWLDQAIAVPQRQKAELLGVGARTYQRWVSPTDTTAPDGQDERAVRVLARLTSQLRHALGGAGVVDWLQTPHAELDGQRPVDLLREQSGTGDVLRLALAIRGSGAA
jgi:uncharacterized protein (DUF2384 family)